MNAVTQGSGNTGTKSKSGKSRKPKQAAPGMGKTKKKGAKNRKPIAAGGQSGKKKTAGRKKTAAKRKSATRDTSASVENLATATGSTRLASLPIDPPPVTFPDAVAAADDPRSLSWMAQQAVSALNAVKAHQAEKGKAIRARVEKDKPDRGPSASGEQTGKTTQAAAVTGEPAPAEAVSAAVGGNESEPLTVPVDAGNGAPVDAGKQQAPGTEKSATGHSGKDDGADAGTQQDAMPQQTSKPVPSGVATSSAPIAASVPGITAGNSPGTTAKRRYPSRLQAAIAVVIVVPLWLYFGAGDETVNVTPQPEQAIASKPGPEPADRPVWQPATAPAQFPEPVPASQVTESLQSTDPTKPVAAGKSGGMTAQNNGLPVTGTAVSPARQPGSGLADTAPAQPVRPPGYRAPGYGYYPPQPAWQPSPYYRPGYSWPPSR